MITDQSNSNEIIHPPAYAVKLGLKDLVGVQAPTSSSGTFETPYQDESLTQEPDQTSESVEALLNSFDHSSDEKRFTLIPCEEFLRDKSPPRSLIKSLLPLVGIVWLYGLWGSFKTFLVIHIAIHVTLGIPFCGRRTRKGAVVYLAGEGHASIRVRIEAARATLGVSLNDFYISDKGGRLDDDGFDHVIQSLDTIQGIALIIFDTQSTWAVGDENSNTESNEYIDKMRFLSDRYDACVMTVHHTTKNGQSMRGAGNFSGSADAVLSVEKNKGPNGTRVKMKTVKQRDFRDDQCFSFQAEEVALDDSWKDEDDCPVTSMVLQPVFTEDKTEQELHEKVIELISRNPGLSQKQLKDKIREAFEVGLGSAAKILRALEDSGDIVSYQEKPGCAKCYSVPKQGLNASVSKQNSPRKGSGT